MKILAVFLVLISCSIEAQEVDYSSIMKDSIHNAEAITPLDTLTLDDNSFRAERYYMQDSIKLQFRISAGTEEATKGLFENQIVPFIKKREKDGATVEFVEEDGIEGYLWTDRGTGGCMMYAKGKNHYFIEISSTRDDLDFFKAFYEDVDFSSL